MRIVWPLTVRRGRVLPVFGIHHHGYKPLQGHYIQDFLSRELHQWRPLFFVALPAMPRVYRHSVLAMDALI